MSKRIFLSTLIWLIAVNLIIKAIFIFGVDLQVQHRVGQSSYGLYFTLLNLCYIFQIVNDFGLNLLHNTETAVHGKIRVERLYQILKLKILLAFLYSLVVGITAVILGYAEHWHLLIWLVVNNVLVSLIMVVRAGVSGMGDYKKEAIISILDKAFMIAICGFLLLSFSDFKIEWFIWAQTASLLITVIMGIIMTMKYIDRNQASVTLSPMNIVFRDTLPFTITSLLMFIYSRSDSILIEKLLPDGTFHVGIYAAGFRLLDAANMIAFLFSPLLIPMYAKLTNNKEETLQLIRLSSGVMICMTLFIGLTGFWWGAPIMYALYPDANATWVMVFRLLILSHIPIGLMYIFGSYLTAVGELSRQNKLFVVSVLISITLNVWVIPRWGVIGAAVVAVITQSFTTLGLILIGQHRLQVKTDMSRFVRIGLYFLLLAISGWVLTISPLNWVIQMGLFLVLSIGAGFLLKLLQWEAFRELINKRVST